MPQCHATMNAPLCQPIPIAADTLPAYRIRQSPRARHVSLRITPADGLVVVVPRGFDERRIPALIDAQRQWIDARLARLRTGARDEPWQRPTHIELPAVGERWALDYRPTPVPGSRVRITARPNGVLRVSGAGDSAAPLCAALRRWLKRRAKPTLTARLSALADTHGFVYRRTTIRLQRSRWGSYSTRGTISLNAMLLLVPPALVDHVLLHELCHTVHIDHGDDFAACLARLDPDAPQQRAALRQAWTAMPDWVSR